MVAHLIIVFVVLAVRFGLPYERPRSLVGLQVADTAVLVALTLPFYTNKRAAGFLVSSLVVCDALLIAYVLAKLSRARMLRRH